MSRGRAHGEASTATRREVARGAIATASGATAMASAAVVTQLAGLVLGVGCGSAMGAGTAAAAAVGGAVFAGAAARASAEAWMERTNGRARTRSRTGGESVRWASLANVDEGDVARDAGVGVATFAALSRGNLGRLLPSDVSRVGANATRSAPARGSDYASEAQKRALRRWFKKFGCHHCGSTRGKVIGDHMPPNKLAFGSGARAAANRGASLPRRVFNFVRGVPLQRFYPQCEACSALQSAAVRSGATKLVVHSVGVRCAALAGAAVGASALHFDEIKIFVERACERARGLLRV